MLTVRLQQDSLADHSSYLSALSQIDSIPVPDLAATLNNPAEDEANEANEANISFLRTPIDPQDEWRAQNAEQHGSTRLNEQRTTMTESQRRERLQRVLARLNRIHEPPYGDRIPSHNSLYDWSPAVDAADEDSELQEYIQDLRRQQPNTHPEVLRVLAQTQLDADRERRQRAQQSRFLHTTTDGSSQTESSLRSAAILQAVRRHPRFNARSRENMARYVHDRERYLRDNDPREPHPTRSFVPPIRPSESSGSYHTDSRYRARRAVLQQDSTTSEPSSSSTWLQQTLKYLANLRNSTSYEDSLGHAVDAGFVTKEFFGDQHGDFLLDLTSLPSVSETSLLAPGATFEGIQQAESDTDTRYDPWRSIGSSWRETSPIPTASRLNSLPPPEYISPNQQWASPRRSTSPQSYDSSHTQRYRTYSHHPKEWPVKVMLHSIDYENMTLSATMVAYDVPAHQHSSTTVPLHPDNYSHPLQRSSSNPTTQTPSASSCPRLTPQKSIKTYLEGEIIDFRHNTLLTERFKSTPLNDITYWRKLAPFRSHPSLSDDELLRRLVSRSFLSDLMNNYILMRWKERCFVGGDGVTGQRTAGEGGVEDNYGLTISGFYYVCLRRCDGRVEGLYCDPQSSPYQGLRLERRRDGWVWPAQEFR